MSSNTHDHGLAEALCRQVAAAVATLIGGSAVPARADPPVDGWQVRLAIDGRTTGWIWLGIAAKDAVSISKRIAGIDEDPPDGAVRDTLRELVAQAVTAVAVEPIGAGTEISVEAVEPSFSGVPSSPPTAWAFDTGDGLTIVLAAWSTARLVETTATPPPGGPSKGDAARGRAQTGSENLDLILDIDLPMSVRFGKTEMPVGALTRLGPGSIIDLGRAPDEPVEVLISGRVVARGDVVVVGGYYGVRITEVVQAIGGQRE
jgi:flagellar motor switch protein FliN/FliY